MKLKLVVRFNHLVVETLDLDPGTYEVGRALDCHIHINHSSIHRRHGQIYSVGESWFYMDHTTQEKTSLEELPISLSSEIEIAPQGFTQDEITHDTSHILYAFRKDKQKRLLYGCIAASLLFLGAMIMYFGLQSQLKHSDPNLLLSQVRGRVVEFEKIRNNDAMKDYEEIGQFKDTDFRERFGFCTGFLVATNVVLTASHCLWGSDLLEIQTNFEIRASDDKKFLPKRVLGFDPVRDFLFIEVEGMDSYGFLEFADDFKLGQTVYTLGNAHGQGIAIREGIMASETEDPNDPNIRFIRFSAGASPGNSGGPLLDIYGRIVALVFAATGAENYNLGTSSKDLKVGFDKFVKNREPKTIEVHLRKLFNFNPTAFLQKQNLPYISEYNEYPELAEQITNMSLTFTVPMSAEEISSKVLTEIQGKSLKTVMAIEEELHKKKELILDWKSFVSSETPVIMPSQFDGSQNIFHLINKRYYMKTAGFVDSPSKKDFKLYVEQFEKEKKFDFQAYGYNTELVPPTDSNQTTYYIPRNFNKTKKGIEELTQGGLYSQFWLKTNVDDPQLLQNFFDKYTGDEGVLAGVYSPFIRPQSMKNFTISNIKKTSEKIAVKDGSGREWQRFHVLLFDQLHLYVYCLPLPEGTACAARIIVAENEFLLSLLEGNFREHFLAHFLENPYFWQPKALSEFLATPGSKFLTSFRGIKLVNNGSSYALQLEGFKIQYNLPSQMQSLRVQTGLHLDKEQNPEWTGFGAEWVDNSGASPQICALGLEPLGSQSVFILNLLRDSLKRLKLKDDIKAEEIPKLWTEKVSAGNGEQVQLFGYCAPLRDNPMEIGSVFADFKKAKPYHGNYKILK